MTKLVRIGNGNDNHVFISGRLNAQRIKCDKRSSGFNVVICMHKTLETLTVHLDGIHANMNQNLNTALGGQTN